MNVLEPITVRANWRELWYQLAWGVLLTGIGVGVLALVDEPWMQVLGAVVVLASLAYLGFILLPGTYHPSHQDGSIAVRRHYCQHAASASYEGRLQKDPGRV